MASKRKADTATNARDIGKHSPKRRLRTAVGETKDEKTIAVYIIVTP